MWAPYQDANNAIQVIFPRTWAAAERFWSTADAMGSKGFDLVAAAPRLTRLRCDAMRRGIASPPAEWGTTCGFDLPFRYDKPYAAAEEAANTFARGDTKGRAPRRASS